MYERRPLLSLRGALDRGRFIAGILFALAAVLTLALAALDGQTGGHMSGLSFGVHLVLMLVLLLWLLPLTLRRALDLGWSVPKACLAVIGSIFLFPLLTLVLMGIPGRSNTAAGEVLPPLPKFVVVAAPVIGVLFALLVWLVFSRLG